MIIRLIMIFILGVLSLLTTGCRTYVFEDIDGGSNQIKTDDFTNAYRYNKINNKIGSLNLNHEKLSLMQLYLPRMTMDAINDFNGFSVYVKKINNGRSYCYASFNPNNIAGLKTLFSQGQGILQPAYAVDRSTWELVPELESTTRIYAALQASGLNLEGVEDSLVYHEILKQRISSTIEYASGKRDSYLSLYDKGLLDGISVKFNKFSYIVMPNSEIPIGITYVLYSRKDSRNHTVDSNSTNSDVAVATLHRIAFITADTLGNMSQNSNNPYKKYGVYPQSLLIIGCSDNSTAHLAELLDGLRHELKLGGMQKSHSIGE